MTKIGYFLHFSKTKQGIFLHFSKIFYAVSRCGMVQSRRMRR